MKAKICILVWLFCLLLIGQQKGYGQSASIPLNNIPRAADDTVFHGYACGAGTHAFQLMGIDSAGGKTSPPALGIVAPSGFPAGATRICGNGKFKIYFADLLPGAPAYGFADPVSGTDRINTYCAVLDYITRTFRFNNTDPIRIYIDTSLSVARPSPPSTMFYARASPFYFTNTRGIVNGHVRDYAVTNADPNPAYYHGYIQLNFERVYSPNLPTGRSINWYNGTGAIGNCQVDLYSVLLHETAHTMGWFSLVRFDQPSTIPGPLTNAPSLPPIASVPVASGGYVFSGMDNGIYVGNPHPWAMTKLVTGAPANPVLNTGVNANNNYWINGSQPPYNHPVYSGVVLWGEYVSSFVSHLDDQWGAYSYHERISPGSRQFYVMGPAGFEGATRREFTKGELETFINSMGWSYNPAYVSANTALIANRPPWSGRMAGYPGNALCGLIADITGANNGFMLPDTVRANYEVVNNTGAVVSFSLSDPATLAASQITDLDGDPISVMPGTLVAYRGCGSGGNNHNLLTISADGKTITYRPRPNFIGRAQFGFNIWDGKEKGSFVFYTILVKPGTAVSTPPGTNIVLNPDFEEGTEVRRYGAEESLNYTSLFQNNYEPLIGHSHYTDSHPYNWMMNIITFGSGDIIRQTLLSCGEPATLKYAFGAWGNSWPTYGIQPHPYPKDNVGERYGRIGTAWYQQYGTAAYYQLGDVASHCRRYTLEFDAYTPNVTSLTNIPIEVGFLTDSTWGNPLNAYWNYLLLPNPVIALDNSWRRISISFWYCGNTPSNMLGIKTGTGRIDTLTSQGKTVYRFSSDSLNGRTFYIDNLSLIQDTAPAPIVAVITDSAAGNCRTRLKVRAENVACNATYSWTPATGLSCTNCAEPIASPASTTVYTLTINDGCRTGTFTHTVTRSPLLVSAGRDTTICSAAAAATLNATVSGGTSPYLYSWSPATGLNTTTGPSVTATPTVTTTYTVTVTDSIGCQAQRQVTVYVLPCDCVQNLFGSSYTTITGTIPASSSSAYTGNFLAYGDLYVDGPVNLSGAIVMMATGARVYVKPGGELSITSSHLFTCPGTTEMWKGIEIQSGNILQPAGQLFIAKSSLIEDALTTVAVKNIVPGILPSGRQIVELSGTVFNRNNTALSITGYTQNTSGNPYPFSVNTCVFTARNLATYPGYPFSWPDYVTLKATVANGYAPPFAVSTNYTVVACKNTLPAIYGIYAENVGYTNMSGITPVYSHLKIGNATEGLNNLFDNLNYGVYALRSSVSLNSNAFINMNGINQYGGGVGVSGQSDLTVTPRRIQVNGSAGMFPNYFHNCTIGAIGMYNIYEGNVTRATITSDNTVASSTQYGITLGGFYYNSWSLDRNTITNLRYPIRCSTSAATGTGAPPAGNLSITNNNISGHATVVGLPQNSNHKTVQAITAVGLLTSPTRSYKTTISYNNLTDVNNGILHSVSATTQTTTGAIEQNTIQLRYGGSTGTAQYGILASAILNATLKNNVVTCGSLYELMRGYCLNMNTRPYTICNQANDIGRGFEFGGAQNGTRWTTSRMGGNLKGMVLNGVIGQQGSYYVDASNGWVGVWSAPSKVQTYVASGTPLASQLFIRSSYLPTVNSGINTSYSTLGGLVPISDLAAIIGCSSNPPAGLVAMEQDAQGTVDYGDNAAVQNWMAQLALQQEITTNPEWVDSSAVLQSFAMLANGSRFQWIGYMEAALADGDYDQAKGLMENQPDAQDTLPDKKTGAVLLDTHEGGDNVFGNYAAFYRVYLQYVGGKMDASDSAILYNMAYLCPMTNGAVVYQARALYAMVFDDPQWITDEVCNPAFVGARFAPKSQQDAKANYQQYSLSPNPNKGNMVLLQRVMDEQPVQASVYSSVGSCITKSVLLFKGGKATMQLSNIAAGIYLLRLQDNSGNVYALKFEVQ